MHDRPPSTVLVVDRVASPLGELILVADAGRLAGLEFADCAARLWQSLERRYRRFTLLPGADPLEFTSRVRAYFGGDLGCLATIPVVAGGTCFQQHVWQALRAIPAGETRSYGELAATLGYPHAARAVGLSNSRNPVNIVVPCHRLVGAQGALTGYSGGLERKQWLLRHEGAICL